MYQMKADQLSQIVRISIKLLTVAVFVSTLSILASAQGKAPKGETFAQRLAEATQAKHSEADEIGISTTTRRGCIGIASTDKSDIGEKCERGEIESMHTGKTLVEKEKDGFDVSLPLHDATGKVIGIVGIGFKAAADQTETSVTKRAQKIASEMEAQIPSKARLFEHSE